MIFPLLMPFSKLCRRIKKNLEIQVHINVVMGYFSTASIHSFQSMTEFFIGFSQVYSGFKNSISSLNLIQF